MSLTIGEDGVGGILDLYSLASGCFARRPSQLSKMSVRSYESYFCD